MPHLRWCTTAAVIGAIIATSAGAGATMIAVGQNTKTKAIVDADIESYHGLGLHIVRQHEPVTEALLVAGRS
jgi:ABC-type transporter Mla maintaining outer membrane lipid asymmetry permease subunit MlaE